MKIANFLIALWCLATLAGFPAAAGTEWTLLPDSPAPASPAAEDTHRAAPGFLNTKRELRFSDAPLWRSSFYEGEGKTTFADGKAVVTLNGKAAALFPAQRLNTELSRPVSAKFQVRLLHGEAELRFLVTDRNGKEFRADWKPLSAGKDGMAFPLTEILASAQEPVRFSGVSLRSPSGSAVVELAAVELTGEEPKINRLRLSVDSAYPLNIENPEDGKTVRLRLHNSSACPIAAGLHLELREAEADAKPFELRQNYLIPPGKTIGLSLPPADRRGVRYGTLEITDPEHPGLARREEFSTAVMVPATPSPRKPAGFLFGVCGHPQRYSAEEQKREAAAAALCGAKVLREDSNWGIIQPNPAEWNFSSLDRTAEIFGEQGLELELIYSYTPRWAVAKEFVPLKKERVRGFNSRPDYGAWREFIRRTAARYRGKIRFFEVWNEPDLYSFANFSAGEYLEMLKIAAEETRKANPDAKLLTGGFTCMPPYFALNDQTHQEKTLSMGKGYYQIHAFHGHGPFSHYYPQVEKMLAMRKTLGVTAPWWPNETADSSVFAGETGQAVTLWKKLFYSWANGAIGYNWYDLRNDGTDPGNVEHNFGMIRHDFNPKAVYPAYNTITRNFGEAEYAFTADGFPGLRLYGFRAGTDLLLAGWNDSPDSDARLLLFKTDAKNAERFDLFDNRSELPLRRGWALVPVGNRPAGVRFAGAKELRPVGEPVAATGDVVLPRGEGVLKLRMENPFPTAENLELALRLPEGVRQKEPRRSFRLMPGEKREIAIGLFSDRNLPQNEQIGIDLAFPARQLGGALAFPVRPVAQIGGKFADSPDFTLSDVKQLTTLVPADPAKTHLFWTGARDLSAQIYLAADRNTLKLKVAVTDDIHCQPFRGDQVWSGDNLQVGLLIPGQKKPWEIGLTRLADGSSASWVWAAPDGFDAPKAARAVRLRTARNEEEKQTVYEAEIPFDAIGIDGSGLGRAIQFNLLVNDNDGEMRESYLRLAPGLGSERNPAAWYRLLLNPGK